MKFNKWITPVSIMTGLLLLLISCQTASKVGGEKMLRFNLGNGKSYVYETVWDMNQEIMSQPSTIKITGVYSIQVLNEDAGIKTLKGVYRNFKMYMKMMGMEINVDTDKPSPPISEDDLKSDPTALISRAFNGIAGKSFTMKVNAEGEVLEVAGVREMIESMVDSIALSDADMKQQMRAAMSDQFNEQSIKDAFAQAFYIFPNKEVKVGDTWKKTLQTGGKMPTRQTTTFKATDIEGDMVTLETTTDIGSSGDLEITGTQTGKILVDSRSGLMVNGEFDQKMKANVQGMTLNITGKGVVKGRPE